MRYKDELETIEQVKDCTNVGVFLAKIIDANLDNYEVFVRVIYLIHDFLIEQNCSINDNDLLEKLLKKYFEEGNIKFHENSNYLFFIGKILYIGEWYFGIDDDLKGTKDKLAFKMQYKAYEKNPENLLFEWAYLFSVNDPRSSLVANEILGKNGKYLTFLKSMGFAGDYIVNTLNWSVKKELK